MPTDLATSLLDQIVSAYVRRFSYGRDPGQSEYHLVTGFVRAVSLDEKGYLRLMVETIYSDGHELGEPAHPGDIVTLSSNVDGVFRLSRTHHPYAATSAPGFPKPPPAPTVACDHEIVEQSLYVIPVRLHPAHGGDGQYMTVRWCERCGSLWQGFGPTPTVPDDAGEWKLPRYAK